MKTKKINYGIAVKIYRVERWFFIHGFFFLSRVMYTLNYVLFNCIIPPTTILEKGVTMPHSLGIVIHENSIIGENTTIYQHVTIGNANGPKIGNNCVIGTGACILGDVIIGNNCKIGANAVVLDNIPENSTAVGIPAKVVKKDNSNY